MSGRSLKGIIEFSRLTEDIAAGVGEAAPSDDPIDQEGAFYVEALEFIAIATECLAHDSCTIQLWGALEDDGKWYKINGGNFTGVTSFVDEISCACLRYVYVQIEDTDGGSTSAFTIKGRGVQRASR